MGVFFTWETIGSLDLAPSILILQVPIILRHRELVRENRHLVKIIIPCPDNLQIILEHKQSLRILHFRIIQGIMNIRDHLSKTQMFNLMREIQSLLQILLNIMDMGVASLEGSPWSNMEVAGDFVDGDFPADATSLVGLFFDLVKVSFSGALFDGFCVVEGPARGFVGLSDVFAGVAAAGFGLLGAVAIAAVVLAHYLWIWSCISKVYLYMLRVGKKRKWLRLRHDDR